MKKRTFIATAVLASAGLMTVAHGDFAVGNRLNVYGTAYGNDGLISTTYGGRHLLGSGSQFSDDVYGPSLFVIVTSTVVSSTMVSFSFDFSNWTPSDYPQHGINIIGLKSDLSLYQVTSSAGTAITDGNDVHWSGTGAEITGPPMGSGDYKLVITVTQVPAPGALALLGLAGTLGGRRRRTN
jgi:MYXO-CTERM domain-containing protein